MNFGDLPVFILLSAGVYLLSVYGLLKIAELQGQGKNIASKNIKKASN